MTWGAVFEWVICCLQFSVMSADEADVNLTRLSSFDEYCNEPLSGTALPATTENAPPLRTADGLPPINTATRVKNIPDLPSASARLRCKLVTQIFVLFMLTSTCLLVPSILHSHLMHSLPGVVADILSIVLICSLYYSIILAFLYQPKWLWCVPQWRFFRNQINYLFGHFDAKKHKFWFYS